MPQNLNVILKKYVKDIQQLYGNKLKTVLLYGSYARGDFQKNSDIDIMILTDLEDDEIIEYRDEIWDFAYDLEYKYAFDITLSPLVKNIDKFNYWLEAMPFYINVQKEGVVLSES